MVTFEINAESLGSETHALVRKLMMQFAMQGIPIQYSAGGKPYMVRLVSIEGIEDTLKKNGIRYKKLEGSHSF